MKILLIGCGKMGSAMMNGWIRSGVKKSDITIVDPLLKGAYKTIREVPKNYSPDYILLAVKPQNLADIANELKRFESAVFISIMAGKTIKGIQKSIPKSIVVRTMPNLPALIGKGVTAAIASKKLAPVKQKQVTQLLEAAGKVVWVNDEKLIDSVTAISGSGPAYVFLFAQALVESAMNLGLDEKTARILVLETLKGSAELAGTSKESLETLKVNVTSKGGTTEAALKVLEGSDKLKKLVGKAAKAAKTRARQLSS